MHRFIHVGFMFPGIPKVESLEHAFFATGDQWIRYSQCSWIVWTDKSLVDLYDRLRPHIDDSDQILIVPIDVSECLGSLSPWIWSWFEAHSENGIYTANSLDELADWLRR